MSNKRTKMDVGFLFPYAWLPSLQILRETSSDLALDWLFALIYRQKENRPFPELSNPMAMAFLKAFEPTIEQRLSGQIGGKTAHTQANSPPTIAPIIDPTIGSTEANKIKYNKVKYNNEISPDISAGVNAQKRLEANKPTLEQVREYVKEKNINANPDEFYDCYEAVGWTSKGEPIKNWKALLSVWGKNENGRALKQSKGMVQPIGDFEQRLTEEDKELLGKHRLPRTSILPQ